MMLELCSLLLLYTIAQGQYRLTFTPQIENTVLTGNLQYDLANEANQNGGFNFSDTVGTVSNGKKYSPLTAGLLSAAIPGAGQFYTKSYWQSAAFLGVEVLTWLLYINYENKGDRQTELFQQYADEHWSVVRYAKWINSANGYQQYYRSGILIGDPPENISQPWKYVYWEQLNLCEEEIGIQAHTGFTHKLEHYGEQQYYEMIGKYAQFGGGWDDAPTFKAGGFTKADVIANNGIGNVSPRFLEYRDMRGEANSFYNIASTVSYLIVANHVFSALEAAWNASSINHKIQLQGHIQARIIYRNIVEFVPTLYVKYEF